MRSILVPLIVLVGVSVGFGQSCGKSCASSCKTKCGTPAAAYDYTSAYYMPDCAPQPLQVFHGKLIPVMEARKSAEASFIRENSAVLYAAARDVQKAKRCCDGMNYKNYRKAAKDLVRDCKRLKDISYGGTSASLADQVKRIEEDFIRLSNCCQ